MPKLSPERLKDIATIFAAGAIIALTTAIVIGTPHDDDALFEVIPDDGLAAAAVCSGGSCMDTVGPLSITVSPDSVVSGSSATISWDASSVPSASGDLLCLTNGNTTCGSNPAAYQTMAVGSNGDRIIENFSYNGKTYAITGRNLATDSASLRTYVWTMTGTGCGTGGGWGNGTVCGASSYVQNMASNYLNIADAFMVNGLPYLNLAGFRTYKWTLSGTGCPAGGGWGNGTACGVTSYVQTLSYSASNGAVDQTYNENVFSIGNEHYLTLPRNQNSMIMYKWMYTGTGCPAGGAWGNGTACGTTPWMSGISGEPQGPSIGFTIGNINYMLFVDQSGGNLRLYRWTPSGTNCPAGGGWGNGTSACRTPAQSFRPYGGTVSQLTGSYYPELIVGGSPYPYLVVGANNGSNQTLQSRLYKWHPAGTSGCPAGGGFGNSSTCGDAYVQALGTNTGRPGAFTINGKAYVNTSGALRVLMPASNCIGNGTACGTNLQSISVVNLNLATIGSNLYAHGYWGNNNVTFKVHTGAAAPPSCSVVWSTDNFVTSNPFATGVSNTGITTGPLTANRSYRLSCTGVTETVTVPVTVTATPTVSIQATDGSATEASGNTGAFTITRTSLGGATPYPPLNVVIGRSGSATNDSDYASIPSPVSVASGNPSATVTVSPIQDSLTEGDETVTLTIGSDASYVVGSPNSATVTIDDDEDDVPSTTLPTLSVCDGDEIPPAGGCTFNVLPTRVREGRTATLYWDVSGLAPGMSCTITSAPSLSGLPTWNGVGTTWSSGPTGEPTPAITRATYFTFICTAPGNLVTSVTKTINTIPWYQEQ